MNTITLLLSEVIPQHLLILLLLHPACSSSRLLLLHVPQRLNICCALELVVRLPVITGPPSLFTVVEDSLPVDVIGIRVTVPTPSHILTQRRHVERARQRQSATNRSRTIKHF